MSILTLMAQLGSHFKNLRKIHAPREHARLSSDATHNSRLLLSNAGSTAYSTSDDEENRAYKHAGTHFDETLGPGLQALYIGLRDALQLPESWFGVVASELGLDVDDLGDPISYEYTDLDGARTVKERLGPLGELHEKMTQLKYNVIANVVTAGSLTSKTTNVGSLTLTSVGADRFFPNCPTGVITLKCTDPSISAPKFSVQHSIDTAYILADGTPSFDGESELQAEKAWSDGPMGVNGIVLSRPGLAAPEESNDENAIFSGWSVASPHEDDCDNGIYYLKLHRDATKWLVYVYRDSSRLQLTGQTSLLIDTGTEEFTIPCAAGGSIITVTIDHDAGLLEFPDTQTGEELDLYIDIGHFEEGDEFSFPVTNDYAGNFSTKLHHAWRAHLPFGPAKPSGAATDNLAGAGAGNVDNGSYLYYVSFTALTGESGIGPASGGVTVADKTADGKVALTSIPTGPSGTLSRKIYRSNDAGTTKWLLTTVSGNVTTTYTDNSSQASLVAAAGTPRTEIDDTLAVSLSVS